ncbi:MAG: DUF177 domain-containing protein [Cyclobacteriaceae bacterium]|nr:DUF177 domain-containing protein [Cyclobacteriaceae bacterium]
MKAYRVNIQGLSNNIHHFDYTFGDEFFSHYGTGSISAGTFQAKITLDKRETFIEANFSLNGSVKLVCDRSLEIFDYPIAIDKRMIFKFGHEVAEVTDEIMIIDFNTVSLELGQYMYEFISLAVPMKKLHPRFTENEDEENEDEEGQIIYSSETEETSTKETDPRWEKLKNLNKNK